MNQDYQIRQEMSVFGLTSRRWILVSLIFVWLDGGIWAVSATAIPPPSRTVVFRNLARGSALKIAADLCGGLPMEVWKSSVVLEHIRAKDEKSTTTRRRKEVRGSLRILQDLLQSRGLAGMWTGCSARVVEGFFSGAVLLAGKETIRRSLIAASPITISPAIIGFVAGAGGGAAQALVMAPTSFLVTATTAKGGGGRSNHYNQYSVWDAAREVWTTEGLRGIYRGSGAVAARQATNWASRQGFTEFVRPRINVAGVPGEIIAGCLGGTLSCWNTPFEIARIHSQSRSYLKRNESNDDNERGVSLVGTMHGIMKENGVGGLYVGVTPRIFQACFQTVFLVCIPRLLER